jgi:hypothetical protein
LGVIGALVRGGRSRSILVTIRYRAGIGDRPEPAAAQAMTGQIVWPSQAIAAQHYHLVPA